MARVTLKSTSVATLYCDYEISQSVANNRSTITLKMILVTATNYIIGPWTDFNGSYLGTTSNTFDGSIPNFKGTRTLATKTMSVTHASDGTATATVRWKWGVNSPWGGYENPSGSFNITLPTIPRESDPFITPTTQVMGGGVYIDCNPQSSAMTHTIKFKFGSYSETIATGVKTGISYTIQKAMASYLPNGTSGTATITVDTYAGGTKVSTKNISLTITVPEDIVPTISGASTTEANTEVTTGFFVQNQSQIAVKITANGAYGSTITDYTTKVAGQTYKGSEFTIGMIDESGDVDLVVTVTDSRGRTATYTRTINVAEYAPPQVTSLSAYRVDQYGVATETGTYLKVVYSFEITSLENKNAKTAKLQYRLSSATDWTDLTMITDVYAPIGQTYQSGNILSADSSYKVRMVLEDSFTSSSYEVDIGTEAVTMDFKAGGLGVAFGKVAETDLCVENAWNTHLQQDLTVDGDTILQDAEATNLTVNGAIVNEELDTKLEGKANTQHDHYYAVHAGGYYLTTDWIGMYGSTESHDTRKGWIGHNGGSTLIFYTTSGAFSFRYSPMTMTLVTIGTDGIRPFVSTLDLGGGTIDWRNIYLRNNPIVRSDRASKKDIKNIDDQYIEMFKSLEPVSFMHSDGDRRHIGFVAQDVKEALDKAGLKDTDFGGFCADKQYDEDEEGNKTYHKDEDGNDVYKYALRYEEFIALNTAMIQRLMKTVEDQQTQIDELRAKIEALTR